MKEGRELPALGSVVKIALRYGKKNIEYRVVRRLRKTLEIAVEPDASVVVAAPLDASMEAIEEKLRKRASWVTKQQRYFAQFLPRTPERRFIAGEMHLYLGRQYRLKIVPHVQEGVKLYYGFIVVETPRPRRPGNYPRSRRILVSRARPCQARRAARGQPPVVPGAGRIPPHGPDRKTVTAAVGAMSPAGRVLLNRHLIEAPVDAIDYVISHELCHMTKQNHGAAFFELDRVTPDWERRKQRLERTMAQKRRQNIIDKTG